MSSDQASSAIRPGQSGVPRTQVSVPRQRQMIRGTPRRRVKKCAGDFTQMALGPNDFFGERYRTVESTSDWFVGNERPISFRGADYFVVIKFATQQSDVPIEIKIHKSDTYRQGDLNPFIHLDLQGPARLIDPGQGVSLRMALGLLRGFSWVLRQPGGVQDLPAEAPDASGADAAEAIAQPRIPELAIPEIEVDELRRGELDAKIAELKGLLLEFRGFAQISSENHFRPTLTLPDKPDYEYKLRFKGDNVIVERHVLQRQTRGIRLKRRRSFEDLTTSNRAIHKKQVLRVILEALGLIQDRLQRRAARESNLLSCDYVDYEYIAELLSLQLMNKLNIGTMERFAFKNIFPNLIEKYNPSVCTLPDLKTPIDMAIGTEALPNFRHGLGTTLTRKQFHFIDCRPPNGNEDIRDVFVYMPHRAENATHAVAQGVPDALWQVDPNAAVICMDRVNEGFGPFYRRDANSMNEKRLKMNSIEQIQMVKQMFAGAKIHVIGRDLGCYSAAAGMAEELCDDAVLISPFANQQAASRRPSAAAGGRGRGRGRGIEFSPAVADISASVAGGDTRGMPLPSTNDKTRNTNYYGMSMEFENMSIVDTLRGHGTPAFIVSTGDQQGAKDASEISSALQASVQQEQDVQIRYVSDDDTQVSRPGFPLDDYMQFYYQHNPEAVAWHLSEARRLVNQSEYSSDNYEQMLSHLQVFQGLVKMRQYSTDILELSYDLALKIFDKIAPQSDLHDYTNQLQMLQKTLSKLVLNSHNAPFNGQHFRQMVLKMMVTRLIPFIQVQTNKPLILTEPLTLLEIWYGFLATIIQIRDIVNPIDDRNIIDIICPNLLDLRSKYQDLATTLESRAEDEEEGETATGPLTDDLTCVRERLVQISEWMGEFGIDEGELQE